MKKVIEYQVYTSDFNGISNWENYKTLEEAEVIYYGLKRCEPANNNHYELLKIEVTYDEENEEINEEILEVIDEFDR